MTSTVLESVELPAERSRPVDACARRWRRLSLAGLLAVTAVLYLWGLGAGGWANQFYAAAVQAGSTSWKAMLFGSSDAANAITVDKTPGALWVMDLSARLFGFNSWSLLVPQALEGVAAVGVLYAAVRRVGGHWPGILAGAVLALTPVAALMFRYNNPDALLVLLLTVAAYCVLRAIEKDAAAWWLPLAGVAVGFGFLAKMMQAFLVLPAFALVYLLAAQAPWRMRILRSVSAVLAMVVSAGWYLLLVELWPAGSRPYIGGSQDNSILELTFGYNGFGRITGNETGGLGNTDFDAGWDRLFAYQMGGQVAWLLPAAAILGVAGLWLRRRAPRTDAVRAALLLWLGWLVVTGVVFSFSSGILHPYYTVALAPAIGGAVGIGAASVWQRRNDFRANLVLASALAATVWLACVLLRRTPDRLPWLAPAIVVAGALGAVLLLVRPRLPKAVAAGSVTLALLAAGAGPAAYALATVADTHSGAMPSAGPAGAGHFGPGGPRPGGRDGQGADGRRGAITTPGAQSGTGGPGVMRIGGPFASVRPGANVVAALHADAGDYTWAAAMIGSDNAAAYQLATGDPVMAIGGYNGTDPAPTLEQFQQYVAQHRIHYFIDGSVMFGMRGATTGSQEFADIAAWVKAHYTAQTIDGVTIYDLTTTP
ncbi:ArnT family glycosyltransferase [Nocardia wallacei]|uniref:ArnT family glycosyltransferase n=1 Tax=Nocardia wallacei TaxID=480035 RepID=UPI003CC7DEC1